MHMHPIHLTYIVPACLVALVGAVVDLRTRRIPNSLTVPAFFAGLLYHFALDGWHGISSAALAALIAFAIFVVFFLAGGMGAGDVKLMTAAAAIAGTPFVGEMLIATAIAGGIFGLVLAAVRGRLKQTFVNLGALLMHHRLQGLQPHPVLNVTNAATLRLPYGAAIAAGCVVTALAPLHVA